MTFSPTRTGTAASVSPAKHFMLFASEVALSSTCCWSWRQAAQVLFVAAMRLQNGLERFEPWSGNWKEPAGRRASGRPVVVSNAP